MRVKNKKALVLFLLAGVVLIGYWLWLLLRPVNIIAVHNDGNHSYVLVRNFPLTDKGKIDWWLKNKGMLYEKFRIPKPSPYGSFTVIFWYFGDGYKEEGKYDRFCFSDMKTKINCIEKDKAFTVTDSDNMGTQFIVNDGVYSLGKDSEIRKEEND